MRNLPERRPSCYKIVLSFTRGALLSGGFIFGLACVVDFIPLCIPNQPDQSLRILFDDLGVRLVIGVMVGGLAGIAAPYFYGRLSKPLRILSVSLLLAYAIYIAYSPIYQQNLAKQMLAAIEHKDRAAVSRVLNRGFHINRINWTLRKDAYWGDNYSESETALVQAVKSGERGIVALLLQRGADVNEQNEGYRPATEGRGEERYALSTAAEGGDSALVQLLLDHRANVNIASGSLDFALSVAAQSGPADIVQLLIQHGANVQAKTLRGETPLYYAATSGNAACGRLLLEHGADVNAIGNGETPLSRAAYYQSDASFISLLLDHGADLTVTDYNHENVLTTAAKANHLEVARLLHRRGLHLHVFEAASLNDAETLDRLLHNGEKLEQKDRQGMTPLLNAVQANNVQAVRLLLSRGADIHAGEQKNSALMLLTSSYTVDPTEMVDTLVAYGIDINAAPDFANSSRETALLVCVRCKNIMLAKALLKHHPDLTLRDSNDKTALMEAQYRGDQEMVNLLVTAEAKR